MNDKTLPYGKPYYIRYQNMRWNREHMLDTCLNGFKDKLWIHYGDNNPNFKFSDLIIGEPPDYITGMFKKQIWDWTCFTWVHTDGVLKAHVHNGPITQYVSSEQGYNDNASAKQIKKWANNDGKFVRPQTSVALFFPIIGMGNDSNVNTVYYDGPDLNKVDEVKITCPTLLRVDLWHSVYNINGPNRIMLMLNFNDPTTLEEANELIIENCLTLE
jgi:hypothetical protein